jgi:hypothetical protein
MAYQGIAPIRFDSVSNVTASRGAKDPEIGSRCTVDGCDYLYVYNAGNSQASPGQLMTVTGVTGYSATVSTTTMIDHPIGVVHHTTLTTGTYGWLLTAGYGPGKLATNSGVAAGQLVCAGGDGVVAVKSISTDAPAAVIGKCVAATGSAGVGTFFYKIF